MAKTILKRCTCKSDFQDKEYGKGMRVHNVSEKKGARYIYHCTVCGNKTDD